MSTTRRPSAAYRNPTRSSSGSSSPMVTLVRPGSPGDVRTPAGQAHEHRHRRPGPDPHVLEVRGVVAGPGDDGVSGVRVGLRVLLEGGHPAEQPTLVAAGDRRPRIETRCGHELDPVPGLRLVRVDDVEVEPVVVLPAVHLAQLDVVADERAARPGVQPGPHVDAHADPHGLQPLVDRGHRVLGVVELPAGVASGIGMPYARGSRPHLRISTASPAPPRTSSTTQPGSSFVPGGYISRRRARSSWSACCCPPRQCALIPRPVASVATSSRVAARVFTRPLRRPPESRHGDRGHGRVGSMARRREAPVRRGSGGRGGAGIVRLRHRRGRQRGRRRSRPG